MNRLLLFIGILLLIVSTNRCTWNSAEEIKPSNQVDSTSNRDSSDNNPNDTTRQDSLTQEQFFFTANVKPITTTYCAVNGCHPFGNFNSFITLGSIVAGNPEGSRAYQRIVNNEMPPSYTTGPRPVSDAEKEIIRKWIEQGARE